MESLDVRIERLAPMRVTCFHAFGAEPETLAWEKMAAWAGPAGLLSDPARHRVFGFNNPSPSVGSPNYGYEFWVQIDPAMSVEPGVTTQEFGGGLYAVTRCQGVAAIFPTWQRLVRWLEDSAYHAGPHACLEEVIQWGDASPADLVLDLWQPIAE